VEQRTGRPLVFHGASKVEIPTSDRPTGLWNSERFSVSEALRLSISSELSELPTIRSVRRIFYTSHAPRISELIESHFKLESSEYAVCKECFFRFDEIHPVKSTEQIASYIKSRGQTKYTCEFIVPRLKAKDSSERLEKLGFKQRASDTAFILDTADVADADASTRITEVMEATRRISGSVIFRSKKNLAALKEPTICPLCAGAKKKMKTAPTIISELSNAKSPRLRAFAAICKRLSFDSERLSTQLTQEREDLSFGIRVALGLAGLKDREVLLIEEPSSSSRKRELFALMQEAARGGVRVLFTGPQSFDESDLAWVDCGAASTSPNPSCASTLKGAPRELTIDSKTSVDPDMSVAMVLGLDVTLAGLFSRQIISKTEGFTADTFLDGVHPACQLQVYAECSWTDVQGMSLNSIFERFKSNQLDQLADVIKNFGLGTLGFSQRAETLSPRVLSLLTVAFGLNYPSGSRVRIQNLNFLTEPERKLTTKLSEMLKIKLFF
jgi:hypothetical protein